MRDYIAKSNPECLKKDSHKSGIVLGLKNQSELAPLQVIKPEVLKPKQGANIESRDVNISSKGDPDFCVILSRGRILQIRLRR